MCICVMNVLRARILSSIVNLGPRVPSGLFTKKEKKEKGNKKRRKDQKKVKVVFLPDKKKKYLLMQG